MHNTSFSSFHKVRDDLVLEDLTLGPDTPAPPLRAFYSNNIHASPPLAPSRPLATAARVKGRVATVAAIARMVEAVVAASTMLLARGIRARAASPTLPCFLSPHSTILGPRLSTCTSV
jgi:hypothetical protein